MAENQKTNLATVRFSSGVGNTLQIKFPEVVSSNNTCFCNRDITAEELKEIIQYVRKKSNADYKRIFIKDEEKRKTLIAKFHKNKDGYEKNPVYIYKNQKLIKYGNEYYSLEEGIKVEIEKNKAPSYLKEEKNDYTEFGDKLFQNN